MIPSASVSNSFLLSSNSSCVTSVQNQIQPTSVPLILLQQTTNQSLLQQSSNQLLLQSPNQLLLQHPPPNHLLQQQFPNQQLQHEQQQVPLSYLQQQYRQPPQQYQELPQQCNNMQMQQFPPQNQLQQQSYQQHNNIPNHLEQYSQNQQLYQPYVVPPYNEQPFTEEPVLEQLMGHSMIVKFKIEQYLRKLELPPGQRRLPIFRYIHMKGILEMMERYKANQQNEQEELNAGFQQEENTSTKFVGTKFDVVNSDTAGFYYIPHSVDLRIKPNTTLIIRKKT